MRKALNMRAEVWTQHGRGLNGDNGIAVRPFGYGIATDFQFSEKEDPNAGPNWNGYLVTAIQGNMTRQLSPYPNNAAWNKNHPMPLLPPVLVLDPKQSLQFDFDFEQSPESILNWHSDADNVDRTVYAGWRPFISGLGLTGSRFWARQHIDLKPGSGSVVVPLDPSNWFDVTGTPASTQPEYSTTLARPNFIGLTFGGGFYAGHGVNVANGNAVFCLNSLSILN